MSYQWYPGHMAKTLREMQENIKLIDLLIEIIDARIPLSGRNPDLDRLAQGRARMLVVSKADLADPVQTDRWMAHFKAQGITPVICDLRKSAQVKALLPLCMEACKEKLERNRRRGINRPVRSMVAGIPNVGKSTFINSFSGSASLKTGDRPGVTRGRQWIRINKNMELLDTPGLLWPKFEDPEAGARIAMIGSIPGENLDTWKLACELLALVGQLYPEAVSARYGIGTDGTPDMQLLEIAGKRGALKKGGEPDAEKAALLVLEDFRSGRLGRITLEQI